MSRRFNSNKFASDDPLLTRFSYPWDGNMQNYDLLEFFLVFGEFLRIWRTALFRARPCGNYKHPLVRH